MGLKKFKPTTPGQRHKINSDYAEITTSTPEKSLVASKKKSGGRNNSGRMTMRYIGGGHKQKYRIIDFKRDKHDIPAVVKSIEYDPNRTSFIALLGLHTMLYVIYIHCWMQSIGVASFCIARNRAAGVYPNDLVSRFRAYSNCRLCWKLLNPSTYQVHLHPGPLFAVRWAPPTREALCCSMRRSKSTVAPI